MDAEPQPEPSLALYYKGRELLEAGYASEAVPHLKESWALAPHANTAYLLGRAAGSLGRLDESRQWFAEAYQLNPRNNMIATAHATALHEQGRNREALSILHGVLSDTPTYGPARKLLSAVQP